MANLSCSCMCLFDTIVELHATNEKKGSITSHRTMKAHFMCIKDLLGSQFIFCIGIGGIYHITLKKLSINT